MRRFLIFATLFFLFAGNAEALRVKQDMQTTIGFFDACEQSLTYGFYNDHDYDIKTTLKTTGTFGVLYPFDGMYHSVGTYENEQFFPQNHFQELQSRFHHRTKEIVYENGVPIKRISVKDKYKKIAEIRTDAEKYGHTVDLLSTLAGLVEQMLRTGKCDFEKYSFNGKKYSLLKIKDLGKERIKTPYFSGRARKCEYHLEILKDAEAGFLLDKDVPIYLWVLNDKKSGAPFVAKAEVEKTPFGKLSSLTTKLEVTK